MTNELRAGLIEHSPGWQFEAMLILERETRRRNNAIRQLRWSDVDQEGWTILWRAEHDKVGRSDRTPLTTKAIQLLKGLPSRGIGDAPVFPSSTDPSEPVPHETTQTWLQRAKRAWIGSIPESERAALRKALWRVGFHAELRAGVRDPKFRSMPPKVQEVIAGKTYEMLKDVYDEVTVAEMRDAGSAIGVPNCEQELRAAAGDEEPRSA